MTGSVSVPLAGSSAAHDIVDRVFREEQGRAEGDQHPQWTARVGRARQRTEPEDAQPLHEADAELLEELTAAIPLPRRRARLW